MSDVSDVAEARDDYRHMVYLARQHLRYCSDGDARLAGACAHHYIWVRVEIASIRSDMAVAAQYMNRLGSAPTIPVWMLPTPEQEARNVRPGNARRAATGAAHDAERAARAADIRDTCSGRAASGGVTAGSLSGPHARTTTDRTAR